VSSTPDRRDCSRREQILEAAAPLFGGRDLSVVTMDEIATRSGVAKGTLYNYFSSKEDLYFSIITSRLRHLLDALGGSFNEQQQVRLKLRGFVVHTLMFLLKYPDFFRIMRREAARPDAHEPSEVQKLRTELRQLLHCVLRQGMAEGSIRRFSPELATDVLMGAIEGAAARYLDQGLKPSRDSAEAAAFFEFLWHGLQAAPPDRLQPLAGARVLVTREEPAEGALVREIERLGGTARRLPLTCTAAPEDPGPLERAVASLHSYQWVVFTSARAVSAVTRLTASGRGASLDASTRLAAVGDATGRKLEAELGRVDLVATDKSGRGLAEAMAKCGQLRGLRILFPRAAEARRELPSLLRGAGATVDEVEAYRTLPAELDAEPVRRALAAGEFQAITFSSGSAVREFARQVGARWLAGTRRKAAVISIGPTTSQALRAAGIEPDAEAEQPSMAELARATAAAVEAGRRRPATHTAPQSNPGGPTP
jgi:uroporphyrinogen-III synthase/AcrR family transcriptional regulator